MTFQDLILGVALILFGVSNLFLGWLFFRVFIAINLGVVGAIFGASLGAWLFPGSEGLIVSTITILLAFAGGIVFALASYFFWSVMVVFAGGLLGIQLALALAYLLNAGDAILVILQIFGAGAGGLLGYYIRKPIIFVATSAAGASFILGGAHLIFPNLNIFNLGSSEGIAGLVSVIIWAALVGIGIGLQSILGRAWLASDELAPSTSYVAH